MTHNIPPKFVLPAGVTIAPDNYWTDADILKLIDAEVRPSKKRAKKRSPKLASHSNYCDCPIPLRNSPDKICDICNKIIEEK